VKRLAAVVAAFALAPVASHAVSASPDGMGQALVYPYYTVQSSNGDAFNTYLSIVNHATDAKALRVRLRESRNSREVGQFNLYLAPNDTWTAALVPDAAGGARLVSTDRTCSGATGSTPVAFTLSTTLLTDGNGSDAARTREGYVEAIEMASMTDAFVVNAVSHDANGVPNNCAAVEPALTTSVASPLLAPSGRLSGTLTLINVANGINFAAPAEALAGLARHPFFRVAPETYVDFNAAEIDPVSVVVTDAATYRSTWSRPIDAVSAALDRYEAFGEFVLDHATASRTELVMTFPTRQYYVTGATGASNATPFAGQAGWAADCDTPGFNIGQGVAYSQLNRESAGTRGYNADEIDFPERPPAPSKICGGTVVADVAANGTPATGPTALLASQTRGMRGGIRTTFENGWFSVLPYDRAPEISLTSLTTSTRIDHATGAITTGAHTFVGLPMVGLQLRSFSNGTLACSTGACMGNYGGAYPLGYRRRVTP
jgi:hypothetical protein